uniref:Uncharacterized protein n=1 Tax=Arundo donax TaxID=35708 RepID=A0A0A9AU72_ARUDO
MREAIGDYIVVVVGAQRGGEASASESAEGRQGKVGGGRGGGGVG